MTLSNSVLDTRFRSALGRMADQGRLQTYSAPVDIHLDIAGVAWANKPSTPLVPKGAVGWGVRLLNDWIQSNYEKK